MTGVRVALDTNVAVAILNGSPHAIARYDAEGPFSLSTTVVGELLFGALNSGLAAANILRYEEFISRAVLAEADFEVARKYASVRLALKRSGRPIPENDLWIAAAC